MTDADDLKPALCELSEAILALPGVIRLYPSGSSLAGRVDRIVAGVDSHLSLHVSGQRSNRLEICVGVSDAQPAAETLRNVYKIARAWCNDNGLYRLRCEITAASIDV